MPIEVGLWRMNEKPVKVEFSIGFANRETLFVSF